jgi:ArsR family transcriptional regulator, arsenate/arsenite/antimonite-responsive transcriptional repressor
VASSGRGASARALERPAPVHGARADVVFRAFADRTRLRILHLLRAREMCVGDLVAVLRVSQPTASRHLAYLRRAGLVTVRSDGLWKFYALAVAVTPFHAKLLDCLAACTGDVPELGADARRAARTLATGGCCPRSRPTTPGTA